LDAITNIISAIVDTRDIEWAYIEIDNIADMLLQKFNSRYRVF